MNKKPLILLSALALLSSCGGSSSSSSSFDTEGFFKLYQQAGQTYYSHDDIGETSTDYSMQLTGFSLDSSSNETAFDLDFENLSFTQKRTSIHELDGADYQSSLILSEGSAALSSGDTSYNIARLRPQFVISDNTFYSDLSKNLTLAIAIDVIVPAITGDTSWDYPTNGKAKMDVTDELDEMAPVGDNLLSSAKSNATLLKDNYAKDASNFTLSIENGIYKCVYETTDKDSIGSLLKDSLSDLLSSTSSTLSKTALDDKIDQYMDASTIEAFTQTYYFDANGLIQDSSNIIMSFDTDAIKKKDSNDPLYLSHFVRQGSISYLSESDSAFSFPDGFNKASFTAIEMPKITLN